MYARIKKSGPRQYLQLVEGHRDDKGKVRQRVIANLGRVDQMRDGALDALIGGLQRAAEQASSGDGAGSSDGTAEFKPAQAYGHVYALHEVWRELGLEEALNRALRSSRRQFDAVALIRAMVFNRLCEPESKLGVLRWLDTVAIPQMPAEVSHDQLLWAMDALMDRIEPVEQAIAKQLRPLLDASVSVVFYDLTTIRSHGEGAVAEDVRAHGMNKRTGGIARPFVLGVVQTAEGLPIAHEVHAGNVGEVSTLLPMIERALQRYPIERVVVIADRGLLSLDNLEAIESLQTAQGKPLEYILAVPGRRYAEFGDKVADCTLEDGVGEATWQERRLVIAHDAERAAKRSRQRRQTIEAIEAEGERMAKRLDDEDASRPQRGRKSSDQRAYVRFCDKLREAGLSRILKADLTAERFSFELDHDALCNAEKLDGKLLLVTNTDFKPGDVVSRYKALADIERGFRVLKNDIDIAPVYHRLPERIRAHALICFMALVLYRVMRQRLKANGASQSPRAALDLLRTIQQHRVRMGKQTLAGINGPTAEQRDLFKSLETEIPSDR